LIPLNAENASTTTSDSHGEDDDLDLPPQPLPQGGVTEDLGEPLPELSYQLDQSRFDEEEGT
jgi:hypothetical protein